MQRKKPYYHLTSVYNVESILKYGLKGGTDPQGQVKTLERPSVFVLNQYHDKLFDYVAINQLWPFQDIGEYAVIEVAANGVTGKVKRDHVAERTAHVQRVIEQEVIAPDFLKLVQIRSLNFPGDKIYRLQRSIAQRSWSNDEWAIARKWFHKSLLWVQEEYESGNLKPRKSYSKRQIKAA